MKEYLIATAVTWVAKTVIDIGVKHSKKTENTIDDVIFNYLKYLANQFSFFKSKK